jgi:hypothetical protein
MRPKKGKWDPAHPEHPERQTPDNLALIDSLTTQLRGFVSGWDRLFAKMAIRRVLADYDRPPPVPHGNPPAIPELYHQSPLNFEEPTA